MTRSHRKERCEPLRPATESESRKSRKLLQLVDRKFMLIAGLMANLVNGFQFPLMALLSTVSLIERQNFSSTRPEEPQPKRQQSSLANCCLADNIQRLALLRHCSRGTATSNQSDRREPPTNSSSISSIMALNWLCLCQHLIAIYFRLNHR